MLTGEPRDLDVQTGGLPGSVFSALVRGAVEPKQSFRARAIPGGGIHAYQPTKVVKYMEALRVEFAARYAGQPFDGPCELELIVWVPRPQSRPARRFPYPDRRPDFDNLNKPICDALQKAAVITDDARIVDACIRKRYADDEHPPGLEVALWALYVPPPTRLKKSWQGGNPALSRSIGRAQEVA